MAIIINLLDQCSLPVTVLPMLFSGDMAAIFKKDYKDDKYFEEKVLAFFGAHIT